MDSTKDQMFNNFLLKSWLREIGTLRRCKYLRKLKRDLICLGLPRTRVRQCLLQLVTEPHVSLDKNCVENYRYRQEKQKKWEANHTEVAQSNKPITLEDQCPPTGESLGRASGKDDEKQRRFSTSKKLGESPEKSTSISTSSAQKMKTLLESDVFDTELAKLDEAFVKPKKQGSAERTLVKKLSSSAPMLAVPPKKITNSKTVKPDLIKRKEPDFTESDSMDSSTKKKNSRSKTPELISDKVGFDIVKTTVSSNQNHIKINLNMFSQSQQNNTTTDININGVNSEKNSAMDYKHARNKIQIAAEKISVAITTTSVDCPKQDNVQESELSKESKRRKRSTIDVSSGCPSKKNKVTQLKAQVEDAESELQYLYQRRRKLRRLLRNCFGECLSLSEEEDELKALRREKKQKCDAVESDRPGKFSWIENVTTFTSVKAEGETQNRVNLSTQKALSKNLEIRSTPIRKTDDHYYSKHTQNSPCTPDTEISSNDNSKTTESPVKVTDVSQAAEDSNNVATEHTTLVQNAESTTEDYSDAETIELDYSTRPEQIETSLSPVNITSKCSEVDDDDEHAVSSSQDTPLVKETLYNKSDAPLQENLLELLQMEVVKSYEIVANGNVLSIIEKPTKDLNQNIVKERDKVCQDKPHPNVTVEDKNREKSISDKDELVNRSESEITNLKDMPVLEDVSIIEVTSKNTQSTVVLEKTEPESEKESSEPTDSSTREPSKVVYGKLRVRTSAELGSRWCPTPLNNPTPDISEEQPLATTELLPSIIENIASSCQSTLPTLVEPFTASLSTPALQDPKIPIIKTNLRYAKPRIISSVPLTKAKQSRAKKQTGKSCRSTPSAVQQLKDLVDHQNPLNDNPASITPQPTLYCTDRVPSTAITETQVVSEASVIAPMNNITDMRLHQYTVPPVSTVVQNESSNVAAPPRQISEQQQQPQQFVSTRRVLFTQSQQRQPNRTTINNLYKRVLENQQHQRNTVVPSNDLRQSDVIIESDNLYSQSRTYPFNPPALPNHNNQVPQVGQRNPINHTVQPPVICTNPQYFTSTPVPVLNTPAQQQTAFPHTTNLPHTGVHTPHLNPIGLGPPIGYLTVFPSMNNTVAHHQIPAPNQQPQTTNQVLMHPHYVVQRGNAWYRSVPQQSGLQGNVRQSVPVMRVQVNPTVPPQQVPMYGVQNTVNRGESTQSMTVVQDNSPVNRPVEGLLGRLYENITPPPKYPGQSTSSSVANTDGVFHILKFLSSQQKLQLLTHLEQYLMNCFVLYPYMSREEWSSAQGTKSLLIKLKCVLTEDLQKGILENWSNSEVSKETSISTDSQINVGNNKSEDKSREKLTLSTENENTVSCSTTDSKSRQDNVTKVEDTSKVPDDTVIAAEKKTEQVVDKTIPITVEEFVTTSTASESEESQKQKIDFSISQPSKEEMEMLRAMYEEDRESETVIVYHSSNKSSNNNCNTISPVKVATENSIKLAMNHNEITCQSENVPDTSKDLAENTTSVSSKILEAATKEFKENSVKSLVDDKACEQDEIISNINKSLSEQANLDTSEISKETTEKVGEKSMISIVANSESTEHDKVAPETSQNLSKDNNSDLSKISEEETNQKSEGRSIKSLMINDETTQNIAQDETVSNTIKDLSKDKNSDSIEILEEATTKEFEEKSISSTVVNNEAIDHGAIVSETSKDLSEVGNFDANKISEQQATTDDPANNSNETKLSSDIFEEHSRTTFADDNSDNSETIIEENSNETISPNTNETIIDIDKESISDIKCIIKNSDGSSEETDSQDTVLNGHTFRKVASDFEELSMDDTDNADIDIFKEINEAKFQADIINEAKSVSSVSTFHEDSMEESLDTDRSRTVSNNSGSNTPTNEILMENCDDEIDIKMEIDKYDDTSLDDSELKPLSVSPEKHSVKNDCEPVMKEIQIIEIDDDEEENTENTYEIIQVDSPEAEMFIEDVKSISISAFQSLDNTENTMSVEDEVLIEEHNKSSSQKNNTKSKNDGNNVPANMRCLHCRKQSTFICERCQEALYCSKICSDLNWTAHYKECKPKV